MKTASLVLAVVSTVASVGVGAAYTLLGFWSSASLGTFRVVLYAGIPIGLVLPAAQWALYAKGHYGAALGVGALTLAGAAFFGSSFPAVIFGIANP